MIKILSILPLQVLVAISSICFTNTVFAQIKTHEAFESKYVDQRNIIVRLPEGYDEDKNKEYGVLYAHDGQNLFDPKSSYSGRDWGLDSTLAALHYQGKIEDVIVVGINNTPKRMREYQIKRPYALVSDDLEQYIYSALGGEPIGEDYLKFIVEELKPFIDENYKTKKDPSNTFIMGSSMGGLISLYAITAYPDVFGGAANLSTHWPATLNINNKIIGNKVISYLAGKLPSPSDHKIYFDYGTETLDAQYEPFQKKMDSLMSASGYTSENWITKKFEGHEHSEKDWRKRVHIPLMFLLGNK